MICEICGERARRCVNCGEDCGECCECPEAEYDADELGEDPETDGERQDARSLNERAAELLLRRPRYPGEPV